MKLKFIAIPPPSPEPEYRNKTALEGNIASTFFTKVCDDETLIMSSIVVFDAVLVSPVKNLAEVVQFPLHINIPSTLSPPLPPPYPPRVPPPLPPPLPPEPLPLIPTPTSTYDLVADKYDYEVV